MGECIGERIECTLTGSDTKVMISFGLTSKGIEVGCEHTSKR